MTPGQTPMMVLVVPGQAYKRAYIVFMCTVSRACKTGGG